MKQLLQVVVWEALKRLVFILLALRLAGNGLDSFCSTPF